MTNWISVLHQECEKTSQAKVAKAMNYSAATINLVLKGNYKGDLNAVEKAFKGVFMNEKVICTVFDELSSDMCLRYQRMKFSAVNPQRVALYKACRSGCPHFKKGQSND